MAPPQGLQEGVAAATCAALALAVALFLLGLALDVVETVQLHFLLRFVALGASAAAFAASAGLAHSVPRLLGSAST